MRILSVTAMRDEGPFILEWLAWHRLLGVTDFLIYSNDCRDGTDLLLDALDRAGVVAHRPHEPDPEKSIQWQALKAAWREPLRKAADWMLISDVDEFPMIHAGAHRFADLIAALPEAAEAIAMPWRLFGANAVAGFADMPVTAQFTRAAPVEMAHPIAATFFKSLFRPSAFQRPGVHRPERKAGEAAASWYGGDGEPLAPHLLSDKRLSLYPRQANRSLVEMHHYSLRSAESFLVKAGRGLPNRSSKAIDLGYWVERNFNLVENGAALALSEALAAEIAALKALPKVATLHEACCQHHRAEIARLLRQPESYRLFTECLHARTSYALPPATELSLFRLFGELGKGTE